MNTDRFSSREEVRWHPAAADRGYRDRELGLPMSCNPFTPGTWTWNSYNAGWADADMNAALPVENYEDEP